MGCACDVVVCVFHTASIVEDLEIGTCRIDAMETRLGVGGFAHLGTRTRTRVLDQGVLVEDLKMILGIDGRPGLMRIVGSQG